MSFKMVSVVPSTSIENRKVQIGSAIFHSGCWDKETKVVETFIAYAAVQKIFAHTLLKIKVPQGDF